MLILKLLFSSSILYFLNWSKIFNTEIRSRTQIKTVNSLQKFHWGMLSLLLHQFLCASRNLTDKRYLQCQPVGCKNPAEGPPRSFVDRECFAPLKKGIPCRKNPEGPITLQRQLRKFCISVIVFCILRRFRAKFCNILNSEIISFSEVSAMIFHHFLLI